MDENFDQAENLLKQLIQLREERLGERNAELKRSLAELRWYQKHIEQVQKMTEPEFDRLSELVRLCLRYPGKLPETMTREEAEEVLTRQQEALVELEKILGADNTVLFQCKVKVASVLGTQYRAQKALELFQNVLTMLERNGLREESLYHTTQAMAGAFLMVQGDLDGAQNLLLQAYEGLRQSSRDGGETDLLHVGALLASWYDLTANYQASFDVLLECVQRGDAYIRGEGNLRQLVHSSVVAAAILVVDAGEDETFDAFEVAYAKTCQHLARSYARLNRGDPALEEGYLRHATEVIRTVSGEQSIEYMRQLNSLGEFHLRHRQYARAGVEFYKAVQSIAALPAPDLIAKGWAYAGLGDSQRNQGNYAQAVAAYRESLAAQGQAGLKASFIHSRAERGLSQALLALGQREAALQIEVQRQEHLQQTVDSLLGFASENGLQTFLREYRPNLDALITMVDPGSSPSPDEIELLWSWALRHKGLLLDSVCRLRSAMHLLGDDESAQRKLVQLRKLRGQMNQLSLSPPTNLSGDQIRRTLQTLESQATDLEIDLRRLLGEKRPEQLSQVSQVAPNAIRKKLPADSALVDFVRYRPLAIASDDDRPPSRFLAIIAEAEGPLQIFDLGEAAAIESGVAQVRTLIEEVGRSTASEKIQEAEYHTAAQELYRRLFGPLEKSLQGKRTVLVSPDGVLHRLPFQALVDLEGKYLVERHRFAYLSSPRDLVRPTSSTSGKGVVVIADPDFDLSQAARSRAVAAMPPLENPLEFQLALRGVDLRGNWRRLEGARAEANDIQAELADVFGKVTIYSGAEALEDRLKRMKAPRILHFATHGFFLEQEQLGGSGRQSRLRSAENPLLRSGLVLAGANQWDEAVPESAGLEDGWLTADEVAMLPLAGSDLVVLSACESGLGDIVAAEGVYGLRRAFLYAGARTLVSSLFSVPDQETRQLMRRFYHFLAKGESKAESLHRAQLEVLEQRRRDNDGVAHPFYWASFLCIGETGE